jgi:ABC-type multidrug transport system permease subunit
MLIFALVGGLTFLQQQMSTAAGVQSRVGIINLLLLLTANYNSSTAVPFAFSRKALFYREKASSMYAPFVYALTLQWVEEPYILVEVFLSVVVFYFLVGMAPLAGPFFYYVFLMYFFVAFATYMGLMWSAAFGSPGAASLVASLVIQLMVLFSGIALPGNIMPTWLLFLYYISPVRWAMEGLVASQFTQYTQVICNTSGSVYTWQNGTAPNAACPVNNGTVVSYYLSDVQLNACCNPLPNRPISAKAYVFTGWVYPDQFTVNPWLGGTNGYNEDWQGFDYLYVILAGLLVRFIGILLTQFVSHQLR